MPNIDIQIVLSLIKEVGLPFAILFWILSIGSQNHRDMTNTIAGIQKELSNLSVLMHDAVIYMRAIGGK